MTAGDWATAVPAAKVNATATACTQTLLIVFTAMPPYRMPAPRMECQCVQFSVVCPQKAPFKPPHGRSRLSNSDSQFTFAQEHWHRRKQRKRRVFLNSLSSVTSVASCKTIEPNDACCGNQLADSRSTIRTEDECPLVLYDRDLPGADYNRIIWYRFSCRTRARTKVILQ